MVVELGRQGGAKTPCWPFDRRWRPFETDSHRRSSRLRMAAVAPHLRFEKGQLVQVPVHIIYFVLDLGMRARVVVARRAACVQKSLLLCRRLHCRLNTTLVHSLVFVIPPHPDVRRRAADEPAKHRCPKIVRVVPPPPFWLRSLSLKKAIPL